MHVEHVELEDVRVAARQRRERRLRAAQIAMDELLDVHPRRGIQLQDAEPVSYTHLTLPTKA